LDVYHTSTHDVALVWISITTRQSSSERQPNFARWTEGATYVWQGDHHVGHWPTF